MTIAARASGPAQEIAPAIRLQLQEAIREIQIIAGLDITRPQTQDEVRPVTIGVTSASYGDGKTTVAIALASSLAHDFGTPVTLVDADLHTHSIGRQYVLDQQPGLREALAGEFRPEDVLYPFSGSSVRVMPAGGLPTDPARMARSERLGPLLDTLKADSTNVILDLPAVLHSMNTPALAQRCDGVIVVVRHGKTTRAELDRVLHLLKDANVIGVVVNRQRTSIPTWVQRILGLRR
jgi:Mrp family chromosome partitioning ATPase